MKLVNRMVLTLGMGIMLHSSMALAQPRGGWYGDDDWDRRGNRGGGGWGRDGYRNQRGGGGNVVYRVLEDLNQVARRTHGRIDNHERGHINRAMSELRRFDDRARSGQFDRRALDRAIDDLSDLARADQLHPRDRQLMARGREALRDLRSRGSAYGSRNDPYDRWGR